LGTLSHYRLAAIQLAGNRGTLLIAVPSSEVDDTLDRKHIFDRFWRGEAGPSRDTGGSVLELAIVRELLAAHDEAVSVASAETGGAIFPVRLPLIGGPDANAGTDTEGGATSPRPDADPNAAPDGRADRLGQRVERA